MSLCSQYRWYRGRIELPPLLTGTCVCTCGWYWEPFTLYHCYRVSQHLLHKLLHYMLQRPIKGMPVTCSFKPRLSFRGRPLVRGYLITVRFVASSPGPSQLMRLKNLNVYILLFPWADSAPSL